MYVQLKFPQSNSLSYCFIITFINIAVSNFLIKINGCPSWGLLDDAVLDELFILLKRIYQLRNAVENKLFTSWKYSAIFMWQGECYQYYCHLKISVIYTLISELTTLLDYSKVLSFVFTSLTLLKTLFRVPYWLFISGDSFHRSSSACFNYILVWFGFQPEIKLLLPYRIKPITFSWRKDKMHK